MLENEREIMIPKGYIERIDNLIHGGNSHFRSREQFVVEAVQRKLRKITLFSEQELIGEG